MNGKPVTQSDDRAPGVLLPARLRLLLPVTVTLLILIGAGLLMTPYAAPHVYDTASDRYLPIGEPLRFREAFFTATSAVCLTGLTTRDTARAFTPFGQLVIGVLIQLGALCFITFGSLVVLRLGESFSQNHELPGRPGKPLISWRAVIRLTALIACVVLAIELVGAALLYPMWSDPNGGALTVSQRAGMSLFHAVSAFCNAGFDLTGRSLTDYRYSMLTHAVILPLIVVGGLGFPVLANLWQALRARWSVQSDTPSASVSAWLSSYTRIVLVTTACLYLFGVVTIGAGQLMPYVHESMEHGVTAHAESPGPLTLSAAGGVLADAGFMSVTSRTAGLHAMPIDELMPAGRFSVMILMLVGGSPGSAAGGMTTWIFALLVLSVVATWRRRTHAAAFGLPVAGMLIRQAAAIGAFLVLLVMFSTLLLCLMEPFTFQALMFEAVSASTNTGLSLGTTPDLTGFGRGVLIASMWLGRIGPLWLIAGMACPLIDDPSGCSVESQV